MGNPQYRVLHIVAIMNRGGTETMLMNHYRALDKSKIQFDFLVHTKCAGAYDQEILSNGGKIFHAPAIRPWSYIQYFKWLSSFFEEHGQDYIAVHSHIQENSGFALYYAHKKGIAHRLMTSHIAPHNIDYKFLFRCFANIYAKKNVTDRLACGVDAGKHLYGKREFMVMHNAIETESFVFSNDIRGLKRRDLGVYNDDLLIGHVGRFNPQKNHKFLIHILANAIEHNKKIKAVFVGEGSLKDEIIKLAYDLGIADHISFLGSRSDVNELLQAFDVFLMPSLYEGLPVSVIEAQAAGLPCVLSDAIDKACDITGNVQFLSLNQPIDDWCRAIERASHIHRKDMMNEIIKAGYDVHDNLKKLLPLYGIDNL